MKILVFAFVAAVLTFQTAHAQSTSEWKRATTGEGQTVEVDQASLTFQPGGVVGAKFRTVLDKAESLVSDPKQKYKSRVEAIEFKAAGREYRSVGVSLLDQDGKVVASRPDPTDWKRSGVSAARWFAAIRTLQPFGRWKVMALRMASIAPTSSSGSVDLDGLVGSELHLGFDSVVVGKNQCHGPSYHSRKMTDVDLLELTGVAVDKLGLMARPIDLVAMSCGTNSWPAGEALLISVHANRMLMIWEGAFLELIPVGEKPSLLPSGSYDPQTKTLVVRSP
jgi:hypothetical protein